MHRRHVFPVEFVAANSVNNRLYKYIYSYNIFIAVINSRTVFDNSYEFFNGWKLHTYYILIN